MEPRSKERLMEWLLSGEPWTAYRTRTDLPQMEEEDSAFVETKAAICEHPLTKRIFEGLNSDGYWEDRKTFAHGGQKNTAFWLLPVLADFSFTIEDDRIAKACEYVSSTQLQSWGFGWSSPTKPGDCHSAIIVESLAKLGLHDSRLQKAYEWLIERQRLDGGFWYKDTGQSGGPREKEPSCAMATMFVLGAPAQNLTLRESETA